MEFSNGISREGVEKMGQLDSFAGSTILLVEDDDVWRFCSKYYLENNGFQVLEASDGRKAMEYYDRQRGSIDLILADIKMPDISGIELARINFGRHYLPYVICTGVNDPHVALELLDYGVQDYVVKPSSEKNLVNIVRLALMRQRQYKSAAQGLDHFGNLDKTVIQARLNNIFGTQSWLHQRIDPLIKSPAERNFTYFLYEFLINAYEHGCMGLTEKEKSDMIENGDYEAALLQREELHPDGQIEIRIAVLENKVTVVITDTGVGFDYRKYMDMSEEEVGRRSSMPNGRGIVMARRHCDEVRYDMGGRRVTVVKSLSPGGAAN